MLWYLKENEWKESVDVLYWLTSCRESVIGSFSSVSSSSKTGLVEVDGSSSSFFSILWTILREQKYTSITGRTWRQFGGSQFNLMFLGKMTNKTTTKEMRGKSICNVFMSWDLMTKETKRHQQNKQNCKHSHHSLTGNSSRKTSNTISYQKRKHITNTTPTW